MRKAKIICTMGPASREEPTLSRLVEAGMDVARLNLSHGTHEDHARTITAVRRAAENAGRPVALLLDLQGPKIRVGKLEGGKAKLEAGAETIITVESSVLGTAQRFSCSYEGLSEDVSIGDTVLTTAARAVHDQPSQYAPKRRVDVDVLKPTLTKARRVP